MAIWNYLIDSCKERRININYLIENEINLLYNISKDIKAYQVDFGYKVSYNELSTALMPLIRKKVK